ncbi:nuclear transport factor 2 family protein [Sphingobium sp.]|uniref:nuclear transport factor 2 family protein n=1 Tax=Sphingobium sp. TaxID=1912891 RepID=UPI0028BE766D|nr:nuclear transport factor 2 family protein [Sphingobium sp.]
MHDLKELVARVEEQERTIRTLADRQAILDCSLRFCRGINRLDRALLRSAFHEDAIDDHGFFLGGVEEFLAWIESLYAKLRVTQHFVTNQTVELDGDVAHAEQYWFVANVPGDGNQTILRGGRYVDRYERRGEKWALAERACLIEWNMANETLAFDEASAAQLAEVGTIARDRSDLSYQRPLRVRRPGPAA